MIAASRLLPLGLAFSPVSAGWATPPDQVLEGTYRLVSATRTIVATGEIQQSFGDHPSGYIVYSPDRRMMVMMVNGDRPKPDSHKVSAEMRVALFDTMAAYGGTFSFDGKTVRHQIDISWNNILTGTTQVREVRKEGDRLIYTTRPGPAPTDGQIITSELVWERIPDRAVD